MGYAACETLQSLGLLLLSIQFEPICMRLNGFKLWNPDLPELVRICN